MRDHPVGEDRPEEIEHDMIASALQDAVSKMPNRDGEVVTEFVVIAVMFDSEGKKLLSAWTARDQRQWTTLGLMDYVKMDHAGHIASLRVIGAMGDD